MRRIDHLVPWKTVLQCDHCAFCLFPVPTSEFAAQLEKLKAFKWTFIPAGLETPAVDLCPMCSRLEREAGRADHN